MTATEVLTASWTDGSSLGYPVFFGGVLLPTSLVAALLWAVAYALLGVISGGIFDSPLIATLLVLLVGVVLNLVASPRRNKPAPYSCAKPRAVSRAKVRPVSRAKVRPEDGGVGCEQP
jgi:hypothetical protein